MCLDDVDLFILHTFITNRLVFIFIVVYSYIPINYKQQRNTMINQCKMMKLKPQTHKELKLLAVSECLTFDKMIMEMIVAYKKLQELRGL